MPELPEMEMAKRYFESTGLHQTITELEVRRDNVLKTPENQLRAVLPGQQFDKVLRQGKFLAVQLDNGQALMFHFGLTGDFKYYKDDDDESKYPRVIFHFENGYKMAFDNMRLFGEIELIEDFDSYMSERGIGPDAMEMSREDFIEALDGRRGMIKSTLMNQDILAGIGNVWSDEILFQCRIHPKTKTNNLSDEQIEAIYDTMRRTFAKGLEVKADYSQLPDGYLLRNRTAGDPCPADCGGTLESIKVSGRTAVYCPDCQPAP
jgi:formamidopyrimidine-DNA glycosylase